MSHQTYLENVSTLKFDATLCNGCGLCAIVCPHRVLNMQNRLVEIVDFDKCMECGACMMNCEKKAITVNPGVGCAAAVIIGFFKNSEPTCGCDASCG